MRRHLPPTKLNSDSRRKRHTIFPALYAHPTTTAIAFFLHSAWNWAEVWAVDCVWQKKRKKFFICQVTLWVVFCFCRCRVWVRHNILNYVSSQSFFLLFFFVLVFVSSRQRVSLKDVSFGWWHSDGRLADKIEHLHSHTHTSGVIDPSRVGQRSVHLPSSPLLAGSQENVSRSVSQPIMAADDDTNKTKNKIRSEGERKRETSL